jgi:hypothetical protein
MKDIVLSLALIPLVMATAARSQGQTISGRISDGTVPLDSARVRLQGADTFVTSDGDGRFLLTLSADSGEFVSLAAGRTGYYNADKNVRSGDTAVSIVLQKLPEGDSPNYLWQSPAHCLTCHERVFAQWRQAKHSGAARNPMLLQLYNGTDVQGNPGIAPGFKLEFPFRGGDCADCHAPTGALQNPGDADLNDILALGRVDTSGVYCDFCHKVAEVPVNNSTGVNGAIRLRRPPPGSSRDINTGTLDDVTTYWMGATYVSVLGTSAFCSGCHQYANEHGVVVDDTYDSWSVSPAAGAGIRCQDCHMKPNEDSVFVSGIGLIDAVKRSPERLHTHRFRRTGLVDSTKTARVEVRTEVEGTALRLHVGVTNMEAGHKLPTGVSFRNILLVVRAENGTGALQQTGGDTLPPFAGEGAGEGNYAGEPGKAFALVAEDDAGIWPVPSWAARKIRVDTRIPAGETDSSTYAFLVEPGKTVNVSVRLLYRAVYKPWADAKGWNMRQYVMAETLFSPTIPTPVMESAQLPETLLLEQNYPNPFNPETAIRFSVAEGSRVVLRVYSITGELLTTLVDGPMTAGSYRVLFDGSGLPSGVYLCRLQSQGRQLVIKMLLQK